MALLLVLVARETTIVAPTAVVTVAPSTSSCPKYYVARNDRPSGVVQHQVHPVADEQACADRCTSEGAPGYPGVGCGCLGFTTFSSRNEHGLVQLYCSTIKPPGGDAPVPCDEGSKCCTRLSACHAPLPTPLTPSPVRFDLSPRRRQDLLFDPANLWPPPTRYSHCPTGYGDYGTRFDLGLGRITVVATHQGCADRCTQYSAARYNGGCKGYMTGMYFGMLFCRSYGGGLWSTPCAAWAVPWHKGFFSGALDVVSSITNQLNVGGNCCCNSTILPRLSLALASVTPTTSAPSWSPTTAGPTASPTLPPITAGPMHSPSVLPTTSPTVLGQPPRFRFASTLGDGMVLQQWPAHAVVWGFGVVAGPDVTVHMGTPGVAVTGRVSTTGMWQVHLPPTNGSMTATYSITAMQGDMQATLTDVLFGDLWVCSGQSNMQFAVGTPGCYDASNPKPGCIDDATAEVAGMADYPAIRLLHIFPTSRAAPLLEASNSGWRAAPQYAELPSANFSAVCWLFGRNLQAALHPPRPIGLIEASLGGTGIEAWSSADARSACPIPEVVANPGDKTEPDPDPEPEPEPDIFDEHEPEAARNAAGGLWNGLIEPLLSSVVKGVIWCKERLAHAHARGESNLQA